MDMINFTVNGERISLSGSEVNPSTSLNDYLRDHLGLVGTKAMCHEGGCGACVVSATITHPSSKEKQIISVNSCLVHILSCHEWDITTVEGLGDKKQGYNEVQTKLAAYNGTQCGYCTPGWVMSMYSLYEGSQKKVTKRQIERSFAGNLCRCTGYRPILDAFKSFAIDDDTKDVIEDLEDLDHFKCAKKCLDKNNIEDDWCILDNNCENLLSVDINKNKWYKAYTVDDVFKVLQKEGTDNYMLVAGNTGKGVYPIAQEPRVFIDISSISTLKNVFIDENLVLGAGLSLNETMEIFQDQMKNDDFSYLKQFYDHLELVANVPVKNIGTIGGNLAMKNVHPFFASDVFLIFETVNATVTLEDINSQMLEVNLPTFLKTDLSDKIILNVKIPPLSNNHLIRSYKIMERAQNTHAVVNGGFHFHVDNNKNILSSNIVYGSITTNYIHSRTVEDALVGLPLFNEETLTTALVRLQGDVVPLEAPPEPSPFCRKAIALGLFYKAILSLSPSVNPRYKSGGDVLTRPVSSGIQTFNTDKTLWPLNQAVPKLEALPQCSGEALYSCDAAPAPRDVHVAFVLSTICLGEIVDIDASEALKLPGVVAFFTAKDIPGKNSFTPQDLPWQSVDEEILASKKILYFGQPIGLIAAATRKLAIKAAYLVKVSYITYNTKPVLSIEDALVAPDKDKRILEEVNIKAKDKGNATHTFKGYYNIPGQYHFTMETQSCKVEHTPRGLHVQSATQWMDYTQEAISKSLNLSLNSVEISVNRLGGGYGGKASRSALTACACALVAHALGRGASLVLPLTHNMAAFGKRQAARFEYEVGVNDEGVIQHADIVFYSDNGITHNESGVQGIASVMGNLYDISKWNIRGYDVLTDKASNTWCRAPSSTEGTAIVEHIMERISYITKKDPIDVRKVNIAPKHDVLKDMIDTFKNESNYDERRAEIEKYNNENAWKKKGLKLTIMSFPVSYHGSFNVTISVYHVDGTILISHGGIEMGQGINTKTAQVCAYTLKVPLDMVKVKGSNNFVAPNNFASAGSVASESVAFATIRACKELLKRLEPLKEELNEPTWAEVVKSAHSKGINLQATAMMSTSDNLPTYDVYGVCTAEVLLDVLTGTHIVSRVDLVEDTGRSLSPNVDVGQIEGSFIMGLGLWTTEQLIYDPSGRLLTNRTWSYRPPGACDIPVDFRVSFTRKPVNTIGVLRSKTTGEPALLLAVVVTFALHEAIFEARKEYGYNDTEWVHVDTPYCVDNIIKAISPNIKSYKLN